MYITNIAAVPTGPILYDCTVCTVSKIRVCTTVQDKWSRVTLLEYQAYLQQIQVIGPLRKFHVAGQSQNINPKFTLTTLDA